MKISFIEPHLKIYGGIRRILELSNRLTKMGHDVTIFHSDGSKPNWMECLAKVKSYRDFDRENHEVIIFNDLNNIDHKLVDQTQAKLKIFYILELFDKELMKGFNPKVLLPKNRRMLILKKFLLDPSILKLANATWEKEWLQENLGLKSELLIGGVNKDMFHPVKVNRDEKKFVILCSGDNRVRKGTKDIKRAIEIVQKGYSNAVLKTYHGKGIPQEKMAEVYSSADLFVEASTSAGWNNPVVEAMACRVPVICTDIGGVKDFAINGKTALLFGVGDCKDLAKKILSLVNDQKLREVLAENAYKYIQRFDWSDSAIKLVKIIEENIGKRKFYKNNFSYWYLYFLDKVVDFLYSGARPLYQVLKGKNK